MLENASLFSVDRLCGKAGVAVLKIWLVKQSMADAVIRKITGYGQQRFFVLCRQQYKMTCTVMLWEGASCF